MSYKRGPNIVTDGLILCLDPANVKSFAGEPTTNLVTNSATFNGGWGSYAIGGNSGTFITEFGTTGYKMVNLPAWNGIYQNFNLITAGIYTFSAKIRYWGGSEVTNGGSVYVSNYGNGDVASYPDKTLIGQWQTVTKTVNVTAATNVYFYLISFGGTYGGSEVSTWDVTQPQIEFRDYATSFVNGTRGTTIATGGGLKDLTGKGNHGQVVNGLKYGSNNQGTLIFDGVNDVVMLGPSTQFLSVYHSYETWIKTSGLSLTGDEVCGIFGISYGLTINLLGSGNLQYAVYSNESSSYIINDTSAGINLFDNKWHHIVCTRGPSTYGIYIDGVLNRSGASGLWTGTNIWADMNAQVGNNPNNINLNYYGEMTGVKIYNKDLSSDEVLQNYNANKSRFGII
jgi:hypothetical protein